MYLIKKAAPCRVLPSRGMLCNYISPLPRVIVFKGRAVQSVSAGSAGQFMTVFLLASAPVRPAGQRYRVSDVC